MLHIISRVKIEYATELYLNSWKKYYGKKEKRQMLPIISHNSKRIQVMFVYGVDLKRQFNYFDVLSFWKSDNFWILCGVFSVSAIVLYLLRHLARSRTVDFVVGFLEVFAIVFGGGNIQYRHRLEKCFFAIALIASFFLVSIYLAEFSMNVVLRQPQNIDTFAKLAKQNVPFFLQSTLSEQKADINAMLR